MKYCFIFLVHLIIVLFVHTQEDNSSSQDITENQNNTMGLSRKDLCIFFNAFHASIFFIIFSFWSYNILYFIGEIRYYVKGNFYLEEIFVIEVFSIFKVGDLISQIVRNLFSKFCVKLEKFLPVKFYLQYIKYVFRITLV